MTILLILWVFASMAVCLAFLTAAARPVPHPSRPIRTRRRDVLRYEAALLLKAKRAHFGLSSNLATSPVQAPTGKDTPERPVESLLNAGSAPVSHPATGGGCSSPTPHISKPKNEQFHRSALVEILVGLVLCSMLIAMTGSLWLVGSRDLAATANYMELKNKACAELHRKPRSLHLTVQANAAREGTAVTKTVSPAYVATARAAEPTTRLCLASQPEQ